MTGLRNNAWLLTLAFVTLFFSCKKELPYTAHKTAVADSVMVAAAHPLATQVGLDILRQGGNAMDATVAVQFALAVVYPRAGNIGGGGFMVIRNHDGEIASIDYREKAPMAADRNMYLDSLGNVVDGLSRNGHLAAGVPGSVAGLEEAHSRYGNLPFKQLVEPAIHLAEAGYLLSETEASRLNKYQEDFDKQNTVAHAFTNQEWQKGDRLVQKELAATLKLIRDQGRDGFYKGLTADKIVAEMQRGNGIITKEDLASYQAQWRTPVTTDYKQYKIISMAPPSSGGVVLSQMLKMVEPFPLADYGLHTVESVHLMAEASKRAYADRAKYLGDADFFPVPQDSIMQDDYLAVKMASFHPDKATPSEEIDAEKVELVKESFETTHTSVVDAAGNAVSVTTTLNSNFGNKVVVGNAGFFLNNEMDDFSAKPGVPNQFGLVGAEANAIHPQKRMLSSMTPTIIEKEGKLFMVIGAPGGSTIITAVYQVFLNVAEFGLPVAEAVNVGRFHHQWLPDAIMVEKGTLGEQTLDSLKAMGHTITEVDRMAVIKAIQVLADGKLSGAADPRNPDDDARGY
ncbi:gamma-glutamyltransferase [Limibacter armeniacum]|uniref:gamma-glutamyltransferase n=1 Tax=Limibacter armeniacum TaxID=466084 RepID=UPI002FE53A5A